MSLTVVFYSLYEFLDYEKIRYTILILNTTICASYPINFGIYCGMSRYIYVYISAIPLTSEYIAACPGIYMYIYQLSHQLRNILRHVQSRYIYLYISGTPLILEYIVACPGIYIYICSVMKIKIKIVL